MVILLFKRKWICQLGIYEFSSRWKTLYGFKEGWMKLGWAKILTWFNVILKLCSKKEDLREVLQIRGISKSWDKWDKWSLLWSLCVLCQIHQQILAWIRLPLFFGNKIPSSLIYLGKSQFASVSNGRAQYCLSYYFRLWPEGFTNKDLFSHSTPRTSLSILSVCGS